MAPVAEADDADAAIAAAKAGFAVWRRVPPLERARIMNEIAAVIRKHGDELAFDLVAIRLADLRGKNRDASGVEELHALLEQELPAPHRLSDLAVDGDDLIAIGFRPGPDLGHALRELLELVVDDPNMNDRDRLLEHAKVERWPASR
jgi:hypothetical protein